MIFAAFARNNCTEFKHCTHRIPVHWHGAHCGSAIAVVAMPSIRMTGAGTVQIAMITILVRVVRPVAIIPFVIEIIAWLVAIVVRMCAIAILIVVIAMVGVQPGPIAWRGTTREWASAGAGMRRMIWIHHCGYDGLNDGAVESHAGANNNTGVTTENRERTGEDVRCAGKQCRWPNNRFFVSIAMCARATISTETDDGQMYGCGVAIRLGIAHGRRILCYFTLSPFLVHAHSHTCSPAHTHTHWRVCSRSHTTADSLGFCMNFVFFFWRLFHYVHSADVSF